MLFSESLNTTNNHALVSSCLAYWKNPPVMALNPDLWLFLSDAKMIISAGSQFEIGEQLVNPLILPLVICYSYKCPSCFCIQIYKDRFDTPITIEMCLNFNWHPQHKRDKNAFSPDLPAKTGKWQKDHLVYWSQSQTNLKPVKFSSPP